MRVTHYSAERSEAKGGGRARVLGAVRRHNFPVERFESALAREIFFLRENVEHDQGCNAAM